MPGEKWIVEATYDAYRCSVITDAIIQFLYAYSPRYTGQMRN